MTTRREMVKAGAGLAAIMAAGKAPAAFVRSLVAARNTMMAGGGKLSAKSYVQDGLVAMWDGIENAGWGVHDPNATEWIELVTNKVCPFVNSIGHFEADRFVSGQGGGVNIGTWVFQTLEVVVARFGGSYCIVSPYKANASSHHVIFASNAYVPNAANAGNKVQFDRYDLPHTVSFVSDRSSVNAPCVTYGDSILSTNGKYNDYWSIGAPGYITYATDRNRYSYADVYSLRLYSRALTAAEVATNYAIDKARFNLPDATQPKGGDL